MKTPTRVIIRAYRGHGFGSGFIKWFTFGEYSHVSFVFEFARSAPVEYESIQGRGVANHPPTTGKDFDEYEVPVDAQTREQIFLYAQALHGDYDWKGIYGFLVRRKTHRDDMWFCSEFVCYCCYKAGYPLSRRDPYRETPQTSVDSYRVNKIMKI